jgi:hypothetical protein
MSRFDVLHMIKRRARSRGPALVLGKIDSGKNIVEEQGYRVLRKLIGDGDGPPKSACRGRLQTATSCEGKEVLFVVFNVKLMQIIVQAVERLLPD